MSKEVLYYPTIEFMDETWLKASLCIWDKIYRIVPSTYNPQDSDEVRIAVDNGLVEDIRLNNDDLTETARSFEIYLNDAPILPAAVDGWENIDIRLHPEKVDARILPILEGLSKKIDPNGFLSLSYEVANVYMLYLADVVSKRRGINKLTDNSDMFAIMHYFANDANFDEDVFSDEREEVTASLVLPSLLPKGIEYMSINEVIRFRENTAESRMVFRESVDDLVSDICHIDDSIFLKQRLDEFNETFENNKGNLLNQAGKLFKDFKYSILSVGLPASFPTLISLARGQGIRDLIEIASMLSIVVIASLADASRTKRSNWNNSDTFFYYQLEKVFGTEKGVRFSYPSLPRIFEEFIND